MTDNPEKFSDKIDQINKQLRSYGREAVQEMKMVKKNADGTVAKDKDGNAIVIGRITYGYKSQYVFDAVNSILLPENWRYEIVSKEIFDTQAVLEVKLFIRVNGEWLCKGSHTGQMNIVRKNVGDAYKGAVTDALQKCFSLLSIGQDAYRGLLKEVYFANGKNRPPVEQSRTQQQPPAKRSNQQRQTNPKRSQSNRSNSQQRSMPHQGQSLGPILDGVNYNLVGNNIIATGDKTYDKKELLKAEGFRWNPKGKNWMKPVAMN